MALTASRGGTWSYGSGDFQLNRMGLEALFEDMLLSGADPDCAMDASGDAAVSYSWGRAPGLEVRLDLAGAGVDGVRVDCTVVNGGSRDLFLRSVSPLVFRGGGGDRYKMHSSSVIHTFPAERGYGDDGPKGLRDCRRVTSFWQMALHDGTDGKAAFAGISGVPNGIVRFHATPFLAERKPDLRYVQWSCEFDCLSGLRGVRIPPGASYSTGSITVIHGSGVTAGKGFQAFLTGAFGATLGWARRPLPYWCVDSVPAGWCSWYAGYYSDIDEASMMAELEAVSGIPGMRVFQLDDGWAEPDAGTRRPGAPTVDGGKFPDGLEAVVGAAVSRGLVPGLWLRPYWGWRDVPDAPGGKPEWAAGSGIDPSHPGALDWLEALGRWTSDRGFRYLKLDFLTWDLFGRWGMDLVEPRGIPHAPYDNGITNAQAYRMGLEAFRRGAGGDTFILGCNCLPGPALGIIDANRIGDDVNAGNWERVGVMGAGPAARMHATAFNPYINDPDCAMVQEPLTLDQARSWMGLVAMGGQLNMLSTKLHGLDGDRLGVVRAALPVPRERFESVPLAPGVWEALPPKGSWADDGRMAIGVFDWGSDEPGHYRPEGPNVETPRICREFWSGEVFVLTDNGLTAPEGGCGVYAVCPTRDHPFVLGTDRHLLQGWSELEDVRWAWDGPNGTLSVIPSSPDRIGADAFTVLVCAPERWRPVSDEAVEMDGTQGDRVWSLKLVPGVTKVVGWWCGHRP